MACPDTKILNPYTGNCVGRNTAKAFTGLCKAGKEVMNVVTSKCVDINEYAFQVKVLSKMLGIKRPGAQAIKDVLRDIHLKPRREVSMSKPLFGSNVSYQDVSLKQFQELFDSTSCHMGQLKLFYALFEFLYEVEAVGIDLSHCLVVYIGAAPGTNIHTVSEFYPDATFLLYDPAPFDSVVHKNKRIHLRTGKDGMFTIESSCDEIRKIQKRLKKKHLLFVSDIRMDPNEQDVKRDMLLQQTAVFELKPLAYMLKHRLPYVDPSKPFDGEYTLEPAYEQLTRPSTRQSSKALEKKKTDYVFRYLGGNIYLQLYAPVRSTETRLIGFRARNKYEMRLYDCLKYENLLNAFNLAWRPMREYNIRIIQPFLKDPLWEGWVPTYEAVTEILLWERYLASKDNKFKRMSIGKRANTIREYMKRMHEMMGITPERRAKCRYDTAQKHEKKHKQAAQRRKPAKN